MRSKTYIVLLVSVLLWSGIAHAQTTTTEQQLESLSEADENQLENDQYLQELRYYRQHPLNINNATPEDWQVFSFLSALQVDAFFRYRAAFGKFISIYELQAVPLWDVQTIRKLAPYITVKEETSAKGIKSRFSGGEHAFLLRETRVLEQQKGFDTATANGYLGSPDHVLFRYRYQYKNLLRYGITGDKDAGEAFGKGAQAKGFDFYSFHLFARKLGSVEALALGDFTVNMGQGLIQWQSLSFKKSADATAIKRQNAFLQPYSSAGEYNFNRGAGITVKKKGLELSLFGSYRKLNANLVRDTIYNDDGVSSFLASGYNRTASEVADRNALEQVSYGGNIRYRYKNLQIGINGVGYQFSTALKEKPEPYNKYEIAGKQWINYSVDYSYTYRNLHLFGEAARDKEGGAAFLNGMIVSVDPKVDVALLQRKIGSGYRALYGNAFTESTLPENETGFYTGITVRPAAAWRLDAYADFYRFPWLKYRVDAPSAGRDFLLQLAFQPSRQFEMYARYKTERKAINENKDSAANYLAFKPKQSWRLHFNYVLSPQFTLKGRTEILFYNKKEKDNEKGYLAFIEGAVKPGFRFSGNCRIQYFETEGYNSRIYAYESDVLYGYSIPAFFDRGFRYYVNLNYDVTKQLSLWARWSQTLYKDKTVIGSGLDAIAGSHRSEIKFQAVFAF